MYTGPGYAGLLSDLMSIPLEAMGAQELSVAPVDTSNETNERNGVNGVNGQHDENEDYLTNDRHKPNGNHSMNKNHQMNDTNGVNGRSIGNGHNEHNGYSCSSDYASAHSIVWDTDNGASDLETELDVPEDPWALRFTEGYGFTL